MTYDEALHEIAKQRAEQERLHEQGYMDGSRGEGTVWYFMSDDQLMRGRPISPIAAEAHKGIVLDGTARRIG